MRQQLLAERPAPADARMERAIAVARRVLDCDATSPYSDEEAVDIVARWLVDGELPARRSVA